MPRQAYQKAKLHWHDYIPPCPDPDYKITVHHRRHTHHTYHSTPVVSASDEQASHPDGNPDLAAKKDDKAY